MAKLLEFTGDHFAHFSDEEKSKIKHIVYRRDFQEMVVTLRKKYGYPPFAKIPEGADCNFDGWIDDDTLRRDIIEIVTKRQSGYFDWLALAYGMTKYNCLPKLSYLTSPVMGLPSEEKLGVLKNQYEKMDSLAPEFGDNEAKRRVKPDEYIFYRSDNVFAKSDYRNVIIRVSPYASSPEVQKVMKTIKGYQKFFRQPKSADRIAGLLDVFNDMVEYRRQRLTDVQIQELVKENHRMTLDIDSIRQYVKRGRGLGF